MARSAEEKLRDAFVPMDDKNMRKFRRLLREVKRECADRAVEAVGPHRNSIKNAVRAAIMGGRHGKR